MYGNENSKKIFTITHAKPREYPLKEKLGGDFRYRGEKAVISEKGMFIFAAYNKKICIFNIEK